MANVSLSELSKHVSALASLVRASGELFEGNCMYEHGTFNLHPDLIDKQKNLVEVSRDKQRIVEIGFNAGHSCLLFLLSNPTSTIQVFDLGDHEYTAPCFNYLQGQFPGRLEIIYGDSMNTLPLFIKETRMKYDLFHVDGGHETETARADVLNCSKLAHAGSLVIYDDVDFRNLAVLYKELVDSKILEPVDSFIPTRMYKHALCKFV